MGASSKRTCITMGVFRYLVTATACSACCFAAAFVVNPHAAIETRCSRVDSSKLTLGSRWTRTGRVTNNFARTSCFDPRVSRRRLRQPPVPLLLSLRTVDVDVIDVTDVTEEETRLKQEQVRTELLVYRLYPHVYHTSAAGAALHYSTAAAITVACL